MLPSMVLKAAAGPAAEVVLCLLQVFRSCLPLNCTHAARVPSQGGPTPASAAGYARVLTPCDLRRRRGSFFSQVGDAYPLKMCGCPRPVQPKKLCCSSRVEPPSRCDPFLALLLWPRELLAVTAPLRLVVVVFHLSHVPNRGPRCTPPTTTARAPLAAASPCA